MRSTRSARRAVTPGCSWNWCDQIGPTAVNPLARPLLARLSHVVDDFIIRHPATLYTLILGGEEIPDLLQKLAAEHADTDPHVAAVNRYHRSEEARHLAFARIRVGEAWDDAGAADRWGVRHLAPLVIGGMFDLLVHPGVYETVGLPGWDTWRAVRSDPARIAPTPPRHPAGPAVPARRRRGAGGVGARSVAPVVRGGPPGGAGHLSGEDGPEQVGEDPADLLGEVVPVGP